MPNLDMRNLSQSTRSLNLLQNMRNLSQSTRSLNLLQNKFFDDTILSASFKM